MAAPDRSKTIHVGQLRIGMFGDIFHRKVVNHERLSETGESKRDQKKLCLGTWSCQRYPFLTPLVGAEYRQDALDNGDQKGKDQGEMAEFSNHFEVPFWA